MEINKTKTIRAPTIKLLSQAKERAKIMLNIIHRINNPSEQTEPTIFIQAEKLRMKINEYLDWLDYKIKVIKLNW